MIESQEPVAWMVNGSMVVQEDWIERLHWPFEYVAVRRAIPDSWVPVLYTTPPAQPQRTWVWLTKEEHQKIIDAHFSAQEMLIAAETKSKEKNNG